MTSWISPNVFPKRQGFNMTGVTHRVKILLLFAHFLLGQKSSIVGTELIRTYFHKLP